MTLKEQYRKLDSTTKKRVKQVAIAIAIVIVLVFSWVNRADEIKQETIMMITNKLLKLSQMEKCLKQILVKNWMKN